MCKEEVEREDGRCVYEKWFNFFLLSLVGGLIAALGIHKDGKHKEIRGRAMGKHRANYMKLMKCQKKTIIKKSQARSGTQVEGAVKPAARKNKKKLYKRKKKEAQTQACGKHNMMTSQPLS